MPLPLGANLDTCNYHGTNRSLLANRECHTSASAPQLSHAANGGAATLCDGAIGASADGLHGGRDEGYAAEAQFPQRNLRQYPDHIATARFISTATTNLG